MSEIAEARVLIVEDDEAVRRMLNQALEQGGLAPRGVRTGEEAMSLVRTPPGVAAVLIDGLLPDMHGVRLADAILDDPAGARVGICFVSGAIRQAHDCKAGLGALSKPLRVRELLDTVRDLVRWSATGMESPADRRSVLRELEQTFLVGP